MIILVGLALVALLASGGHIGHRNVQHANQENFYLQDELPGLLQNPVNWNELRSVNEMTAVASNVAIPFTIRGKTTPDSQKTSSIPPMTPCAEIDAYPNGRDSSLSTESCMTACNGGDQNFCNANCIIHTTSPGFACNGICRKSKTETECGRPVRQTCLDSDLVCSHGTDPPKSGSAPTPTSPPSSNTLCFQRPKLQ